MWEMKTPLSWLRITNLVRFNNIVNTFTLPVELELHADVDFEHHDGRTKIWHPYTNAVMVTDFDRWLIDSAKELDLKIQDYINRDSAWNLVGCSEISIRHMHTRHQQLSGSMSSSATD